MKETTSEAETVLKERALSCQSGAGSILDQLRAAFYPSVTVLQTVLAFCSNKKQLAKLVFKLLVFVLFLRKVLQLVVSKGVPLLS